MYLVYAVVVLDHAIAFNELPLNSFDPFVLSALLYGPVFYFFNSLTLFRGYVLSPHILRPKETLILP